MKVDKCDFFNIQSKFENIPFSQTEEWLLSQYIHQQDSMVYFVDNPNDPQICCWGVFYEKKIIGKYLIINGETYKAGISNKRITDFYKTIIFDSGCSTIMVSSVNVYDSQYEIGIRRSGFLRPLGQSLSPLTLFVKPMEPFNFHRNWRRNVKKSIENGVTFRLIDNPNIESIRIFIQLFNQLKQRKNLSFKLTEDGVITLLNSSRFKLFFVYDNDNNPIAGRIIYVFNEKSYDIYAANSQQALQTGAVYHLQQGVLEYLRDNNIEQFDYGRIPPGVDNMDAIYVSKSYSGGEPITYNGEWLYTESKLLDFLYSFYKYYIIKRKRY